MHYPSCLVRELADALLKGLNIENPTSKQYSSAESLVMNVILKAEGGANNLLSPKEQVCLQLAACGYSAEETAEKLSLSKGTIKNYRERIRQKLECKTMAQAVFKVFG